METRQVLFSDLNKKRFAKVELALPGNVLNPPHLVLYENRLFEYKGTGMGDPGPTNFYHEIQFHNIQACTTRENA
jgi:hypothetical protein